MQLHTHSTRRQHKQTRAPSLSLLHSESHHPGLTYSLICMSDSGMTSNKKPLQCWHCWLYRMTAVRGMWWHFGWSKPKTMEAKEKKLFAWLWQRRTTSGAVFLKHKPDRWCKLLKCHCNHILLKLKTEVFWIRRHYSHNSMKALIVKL